jgi:transposase
MAEQKPSGKRYPPELRERAIRLSRELTAEQGGQSFGVVAKVSRQLGIGPETLRKWLRQADIDAGTKPGTSTDEAKRIADLEREVKDLRRANDILKAASVFFATELDGRPKK